MYCRFTHTILSCIIYYTRPVLTNQRPTTLCVLCSWDSNFQSWQPSQHIVLEKNIDNRLHFRLSGIRELNTEQEVKDAQRQTEADGLILLSEENTSTTERASTQTAAIPIPHRRTEPRPSPRPHPHHDRPHHNHPHPHRS